MSRMSLIRFKRCFPLFETFSTDLSGYQKPEKELLKHILSSRSFLNVKSHIGGPFPLFLSFHLIFLFLHLNGMESGWIWSSQGLLSLNNHKPALPLYSSL